MPDSEDPVMAIFGTQDDDIAMQMLDDFLYDAIAQMVSQLTIEYNALAGDMGTITSNIERSMTTITVTFTGEYYKKRFCGDFDAILEQIMIELMRVTE